MNEAIVKQTIFTSETSKRRNRHKVAYHVNLKKRIQSPAAESVVIENKSDETRPFFYKMVRGHSRSFVGIVTLRGGVHAPPRMAKP